jgi:hypothetical protein
LSGIRIKLYSVDISYQELEEIDGYGARIGNIVILMGNVLFTYLPVDCLNPFKNMGVRLDGVLEKRD